MLTSHELGFYKTFSHSSLKPPRTGKKAKPEVVVVPNRDYLYLYLKKMSFRGKVSLSQKDIANGLGITAQTVRRGQQRLEKAGLLEKVEGHDPALKTPTVFRIKNIG